jgi:WD40 repeat protein
MTLSECPNCGTNFEAAKQESNKDPEKLASAQPASSKKELPIWLQVNTMTAQAQACLQKNKHAEALDLLYTALELAAANRRENPSLGQVIRSVLEGIENMEMGLLPSGAAQAVTAKNAKDGSLPEFLVKNTKQPRQNEPATPVSKPKATRPEIEPDRIGLLATQSEWRTGEDELFQLAFSPDGSLLAATAGNDIRVHSFPDGKLMHTLRGHVNTVLSIAISLDGKLLASGSTDWDILIWDLVTGRQKRKFEVMEEVFSLAFSPKQRLLASGSVDRIVRFWDIDKPDPLVFKGSQSDAVNCVTFSPQGRLVASVSEDGMICLWEVEARGLMRKWKAHPSEAIPAVAFSARGNLIATGSDKGNIRLWRATTGESVYGIHWKTESIETLAYAPNCLLLAAGTDHGSLGIFRVSDGQLLWAQEFPGCINSVVFSPDGSCLVVGGDAGSIALLGLPKK